MWELTELSGGLAAVLLPLFLLAVPFAVLLAPLVVVLVVTAALAAVAAVPVFLVRRAFAP